MSVRPPRKPRARPALRAAQVELTRDRIESALLELLDEMGAVDSISFKAVAERASVTQMTVYRHFPTREALLGGLWQRLNREMGPDIGLPQSTAELLAQHARLFDGFDHIAARIVASLTTRQGREMRASLNKERRQAFLAIVAEHAPGLPPAAKMDAAAVLQLLHSAHAWASMREQWGLSGAEAGRATKWAIKALLQNLRTQK